MRLRRGDAVLVYSTRTGRVRRWLVPDAAGPVDAALAPGERAVHVPRRFVGQLDVMQGIVTGLTGVTPAGDRYALVSRQTGAVVGACVCDPAIDPPIPGVDLVPHASAGPGWTYADGAFVPPASPGPPGDH